MLHPGDQVCLKCSIPTDTRIVFSVIPACAASLESLEACDIVSERFHQRLDAAQRLFLAKRVSSWRIVEDPLRFRAAPLTS